MKDYKSGGHAAWNCKYHLAWITKYRYPALVGDVGQRVRELLREISRSVEMTIYAGSINRDHVPMLIGMWPHLSVSKAVQYLKGKNHTGPFPPIFSRRTFRLTPILSALSSIKSAMSDPVRRAATTYSDDMPRPSTRFHGGLMPDEMISAVNDIEFRDRMLNF
jgi:REP element-mobilizing transposase RayT